MIFLISYSVGILTVLTQTILIRYEFSSVTMFVSKQKNNIFDEIRSKLRLCVQNNVEYYNHFKWIHVKHVLFPFSNGCIHTCSNVWFRWKLFWTMFPNKIFKCGHFYTLHMYPVITRQSDILNFKFSRHIGCSNSNYSDQIWVQ